jgi:hypothetical protein
MSYLFIIKSVNQNKLRGFFATVQYMTTEKRKVFGLKSDLTVVWILTKIIGNLKMKEFSQKIMGHITCTID